MVMARTLTWGHHNLKATYNERGKGTFVSVPPPHFTVGKESEKRINYLSRVTQDGDIYIPECPGVKRNICQI